MQIWLLVCERSVGPFEVPEIQKRLQSKELSGDTLACTTGDEQWRALREMVIVPPAAERRLALMSLLTNRKAGYAFFGAVAGVVVVRIAMVVMNTTSAVSDMKVGMAALGNKDYQAAISAFSIAVERLPENATLYLLRAEAHLLNNDRVSCRKDLDCGIGLLERSSQRSPNERDALVDAYRLRANLHRRLGQDQQAKDDEFKASRLERIGPR